MSGTIQTVKTQVDQPNLRVGQPVTTCDAREVFGYITECLSTGKTGFMMECNPPNDSKFVRAGEDGVKISPWLVSYLDCRDVETVYINEDGRLHEFSFWEVQTGKEIRFKENGLANANNVWLEEDWELNIQR